jgi:hypothetical protein
MVSSVVDGYTSAIVAITWSMCAITVSAVDVVSKQYRTRVAHGFKRLSPTQDR